MVTEKQGMGGDKWKLDNVFTNVMNVGNTWRTEPGAVHQESRDKPQEEALIRV